jgi:alkylation response protein AidB-like acyl-CoA dehydrogenase
MTSTAHQDVAEMLADAADGHAQSLSDTQTAAWAELASFGWPEMLTGMVDDPVQYRATLLLLAHTLGRHMKPTPFIEFGALSLSLLIEGGPAAWCKTHANGTAPIVTAWFERTGDPLGKHPTCSLGGDGSTLRLNGAKRFVVGAPLARHALVSAKLAGQLRFVLLPLDVRGVKVEPYRLVDGSLSADLQFDNVELPPEKLFGPETDFQALADALETAVIASLGEAIGCLDSALAHSIEHVKLREQFGAPLARLQVVRHKIAEMFMVVEQLRSLAMAAASERDAAKRSTAVHAAKVYMGRRGVWALEQAVQLFGAMGVTEEGPVGYGLKRLIVLDRLFGNADHHAEALCRELAADMHANAS